MNAAEQAFQRELEQEFADWQAEEHADRLSRDEPFRTAAPATGAVKEEPST